MIFLKKHLNIYRDGQTTCIRYIAIDNLAHLYVEQPNDDLFRIVKVEALIRGWIARFRFRKMTAGYVTRFFRIFKDGQRAMITLWKVIVARTVKKEKIRTEKKKRKGGKLEDKKSEQVAVEEQVEKIEAFKIDIQNVYIEENKFEEVIFEIPPKEILIDTLTEVIDINWKDTFEHYKDSKKAVKGEYETINVDWIKSIKVHPIEKDLLTRITNLKKQKNSYFRKIGRDGLAMWDMCDEYYLGKFVFVLYQSGNPIQPESKLIQIRAFEIDSRRKYDPNKTVAMQTLTVQQMWEMFYPALAA